MIHNAFVRTPDPYAGLFRLQGGKSQVLCHADDLGAGASTIVTWSSRHGALAGTSTGSPTVNATGWSGGGGLTLKTASLNGTSQYFSFNAEASNYTSTTAFTWIIAGKFTASALGRNVLFLGSSATANNYRGFTINVTNDFAFMSSNRNGTTEFDGGTAVSEGVQGIWIVSLTGGSVIIKQALAGGITTLLSTTHAMSGTLNVDRLTLGTLLTSGSAAGHLPGEIRFLSCYRGAGLSSADCDRALNRVRHTLRCPL